MKFNGNGSRITYDSITLRRKDDGRRRSERIRFVIIPISTTRNTLWANKYTDSQGLEKKLPAPVAVSYLSC